MNLKEHNKNLYSQALPDNKFDSFLNYRSRKLFSYLELSVILNIYVKPVDTVYGSWSKVEFDHFKNTIKMQGENYWNNKFWFVNLNSKLDIKLQRATIRPNIKCKMEINFKDDPAQAHKTISAIYVNPKYFKNFNNMSIRSSDVKYDNGDIIPSIISINDEKGKAVTVEHDTIIHEIGHAIGLDHPGMTHNDPACISLHDRNQTVCYGVGRTEYMIKDVMGAGKTLYYYHSSPWQLALIQHTGYSIRDFEVRMFPVETVQYASKN